MRGIVELEVLKAIERQLPAGIPIRNFFDLIVGTRYVTLMRSIFTDLVGNFEQHGIIDGHCLPKSGANSVFLVREASLH